MRSYSVVAAALALDVSPKWLDNLLSQNRVAGVSQSRQGVARRIAPGALYVIATVSTLNSEFQIPVAGALELAHGLWAASPQESEEAAGVVRRNGISIELDRHAIRRRVEAGLADALEITPRPRRGRPPRKPRSAAA